MRISDIPTAAILAPTSPTMVFRMRTFGVHTS